MIKHAYKLLLVLATLGLVAADFAQGQNVAFKQLFREEGLRWVFYSDAESDSLGNMWMSSSGGLARFDGRSFENWSIGFVSALHRGPDKRLWAATQRGLMRIDEKAETRIPYFTETDSTTLFNIASTQDGGLVTVGEEAVFLVYPQAADVRVIDITPQDSTIINRCSHLGADVSVDVSGTIWKGTNVGALCSFSPSDSSWTFHMGAAELPVPNDSWSFHGELGDFVLGTRAGILYKMTSGKYSRVLSRDAVVNGHIRAVHVLPDHTVLIGEDGYGFLQVDSFGEVLRRFPIDTPGIEFEDIVMDPSGFYFWATTKNSGLVRLDKESGSTDRFSTASEDLQEIPANSFVFSRTDHHGRNWFLTRANGFVVTESLPIDSRRQELLGITGASAWNGSALAYQDDTGIKILEPGKSRSQFSLNTLEVGERVEELWLDDSGSLMVVTGWGVNPRQGNILYASSQAQSLSRLEGQRVNTIRAAGFWGEKITAITKDAMFVVYDIDSRSWTNEALPGLGEGPFNNTIRFMTSLRDGGLVFGGDEFLWTKRDSSSPVERITFPDSTGSLDRMAIFVEKQDGNFWMGDWRDGIYLLDSDFNVLKHTREPGVARTTLFRGATVDENGHLWFFNPDQIQTVYEQGDSLAWRQFFERDGVLTNDMRPIRMTPQINRYMVVPGSSWIETVDLSRTGVASSGPVPVFISEIESEGISTRYTQTSFESNDSTLVRYADTVVLPGSGRNATIRFGANYLHPDPGLVYRTRINGGSWETLGSNGQLTLVQMPAGENSVELTAVISNRIVENRILTILVPTPWFQAWWFRTLAAVGLGFIYVGASRYQRRRLERENLRLEGIVEERTSKLVAAEERQRAAIEAGDVGLWEYNLQTGAAYFSLRYYEILGFSEADFADGRNIWDEQIHPKDRKVDDKRAAEYVARGPDGTLEMFASEVRMKHKDGSWRWIAVRGRIAEWDIRNEPVRWVGSLIDITDQVQTNQDLEEARDAAHAANDAKSSFLANMSHEIRTPMNAVIGFTELMQDGIEDPKHKRYLSIIQSSGKSLLALINDILDLSKVEAGKFTLQPDVTDVGEFMDAVIRIFGQKAEAKGLKLILESEESVPEDLILDEVRLRQVIVNLLGNAIKFTEEGSVTLSISTDRQKEDGSSTDVLIQVADTGIGIPPDQLQSVFGAFEQTKGQKVGEFGGTGLGLAISKKLIELMGGKIWVESELASGSVFKIMLPDIPVSAVKKEKDGGINSSHIQFEPATILVADDIETNRELVVRHLEKFGIKSVEATDGVELVEKAKSESPDLILTDLRMPRMTGFEAAKILKADEATKHIPLVALTASILIQSEEMIRDYCVGYLRKPIMRSELIEELANHLPHTRSDEPISTQTEGRISFNAETVPEEMKNLILESADRLKGLLEEQAITEIEQLGSEFKARASENGYLAGEQWAEQLISAVSLFDLESMNNTAQEFLNVADEVKQTD